MTEPDRQIRADASNLDYLALDDRALLGQCTVDVYRASGPGGQKRNKTESAVRLRHHLTGLSVKAEESRSQHENKARAIKRLRAAIALHVRRPLTPEGYRPSELLAGCISAGGKLSVGQRDARYWPALWEIFDLLAACGVRLSTCAEHLGVSTGQLSAFLRDDSAAWRRVNEMRTAAGLKALK